MDNKAFESDNIQAELNKSWHIPRPTLARSSMSSEASSNHSTQSARSGSLLLTAANLAQIEDQERHQTRQQNLQYYLENHGDFSLPVKDLKKPDPDTISIASSTHFTVVNMNTRPVVPQRGFCRKHQLTILVCSMCALIMIGLITAIFLLEMRARRQQH